MDRCLYDERRELHGLGGFETLRWICFDQHVTKPAGLWVKEGEVGKARLGRGRLLLRKHVRCIQSLLLLSASAVS